MSLGAGQVLTITGKGVFGKVANYSALPAANLHNGETWICLSEQGTSWLPGSLGGTFYDKGQYYSDGTNWIYDSTPYQASQSVVNAGLIDDQFVSPNTLANSSWAFTTAKVLATILSGLSVSAGGTIIATDTILEAFGKLQTQINNISSVGILPLEPVISQINTPPVTPAIGDRYLVGTIPTGVFVGNANNIAIWGGASYTFVPPVTNNTVYVTATLTTLRYNGVSWVAYTGSAVLQNGNTLGVALNIGTNDNFDVNFKRNNVAQWTINSSGWLVRATGTKIISLNDGFMTITDPATNATPGLQINQTTTLNRFSQFVRFGSTGSGNFTGAAIASNDTLLIANGGNSSNPYPIFIRGSILYSTTGHTATNIGTRLDTVGLRIGALNTLHTSNTARLELPAGAATVAPLKLNSGTNLTTPVNGVIEYNGTNLFFTRTGAVREGVITQSAVTTEALTSDTSVTINIGGVTYKLLAKA